MTCPPVKLSKTSISLPLPTPYPITLPFLVLSSPFPVPSLSPNSLPFPVPFSSLSPSLSLPFPHIQLVGLGSAVSSLSAVTSPRRLPLALTRPPLKLMSDVVCRIKQTLPASCLGHVLSTEGTDWFRPDKLTTVIDTYLISHPTVFTILAWLPHIYWTQMYKI